MSERNKELARTIAEEVWSRGNYDLVDELIANNYVGHPSEVRGVDGYKQFFADLRHAFPDIHFTVDDAIAEGDRVVVRWTARGTHQGEYEGIPATGKRSEFTGVDALRFVDDKATECWGQVDMLALLTQLGVISLPAREQTA